MIGWSTLFEHQSKTMATRSIWWESTTIQTTPAREKKKQACKTTDKKLYESDFSLLLLDKIEEKIEQRAVNNKCEIDEMRKKNLCTIHR